MERTSIRVSIYYYLHNLGFLFRCQDNYCLYSMIFPVSIFLNTLQYYIAALENHPIFCGSVKHISILTTKHQSASPILFHRDFSWDFNWFTFLRQYVILPLNVESLFTQKIIISLFSPLVYLVWVSKSVTLLSKLLLYLFP